jgi:hypothetical protein
MQNKHKNGKADIKTSKTEIKTDKTDTNTDTEADIKTEIKTDKICLTEIRMDKSI